MTVHDDGPRVAPGPSDKASALRRAQPNSTARHRTLNLIVDAALAADDALVRDDAEAMRVAVSLLARHSRKLMRGLSA